MPNARNSCAPWLKIQSVQCGNVLEMFESSQRSPTEPHTHNATLLSHQRILLCARNTSRAVLICIGRRFSGMRGSRRTHLCGLPLSLCLVEPDSEQTQNPFVKLNHTVFLFLCTFVYLRNEMFRGQCYLYVYLKLFSTEHLSNISNHAVSLYFCAIILRR